MAAVRTLILEYVDRNGASHIREMHIQVLQQKPGTPEHTIRARLSEAVADGVLSRVGDGFYDLYAEDEDMTSVVSYPSKSFSFSGPRSGLDGHSISPGKAALMFTRSATQPHVSMQPSRRKSLAPVASRSKRSRSAKMCRPIPNCLRLF